MLVIRLGRVGRENLQTFRLVVQEKTVSPKRGKIVATVGNYDPKNPENKLIFDAEKIEKFIRNGATPSDTVARLLLKNGFKKELVEKFVVKYSKQKARKSAEEKPAAPAPAAENEKPADAPAEEKKDDPAPTDDSKKEEAPAESTGAAEKPAEEQKDEPAPAEGKPAE